MFIINKREEVNFFRRQRELKCFPIINRGKLWYDTLTPEQYSELKEWYRKWLDVTKTFVIPDEPEWLNKKIEMEEVIW